MNMWLLAWYNILRERRRSTLTILITALGCVSMLVAGGFALYTYEQLEEGAAYQFGHITVTTKNQALLDEEEPLQYGIENYPAFIEQLSKIKQLQTLLPKVELSGLISNGNKSIPFMGVGADIPAEKKILKDMLSISQEELDESINTYGANIVLIGQGLARSLNAQQGTGLTLLSTTTKGSMNAIDVVVAGIVATGWKEVDQRLIYMNVGLAQRLLMGDKLSALSLYLTDTKHTHTVLETLKAEYPEYSFKPWWEQAVYYQSVRQLYNRIFGLLGIIISFLVFFSVSNTLTMAVVERTREIGTLRALGTLPKEIVNQFLREGILMGIAGTVLGILISMIIVFILPYAGLQMPPPPGRTVGYPLLVSASFSLYAVTAIGIIILCAAAAWLASYKAAKKPIVEALIHV